MVPLSNYIKYAYLAYFSRPAGERILYRRMRSLPVRSIVEIGMSSLRRTERIIRQAQATHSTAISYTAIDLFELRADLEEREPLPLKDVYRRLKPSGVQVRLIPGLPAQAVPRKANELVSSDLLLVNERYEAEFFEQSALYVPRMLHRRSLVFVEGTVNGQPRLRPVDTAGLLAERPLRRAA